MAEKKAILVIGAGDATGGAIAKRFAREGYVACVTRRSADKLAPLVEEIRDRQRLSFGRPASFEEAPCTPERLSSCLTSAAPTPTCATRSCGS